MIGNFNQVSFHYAVDDKEVVQGIPINRNAWHASDGANGTGNRRTIAIEICYSKSGGERFTKAEQNAAKLGAQLLKENGWSIVDCYQHADWSNKDCPQRTRELGWQRFLNMIQSQLDTLNTSHTNSINQTYQVVAGDTLSAIAKRFDTTVTILARLNSISDVNNIKIGQILTIPSSTSSDATNSTQRFFPATKTVNNSLQDTLFKIGEDGSYNARLKIARANGFTGDSYKGLASQNIKLLGLLNTGTLVHP